MDLKNQKREYPERLMLTYKPEDNNEPTEDANSPVEAKPVPMDSVAASNDEPVSCHAPSPPTVNSQDPNDLLGLASNAPNASSIEESNTLALAIVPTDATSNGSNVVQSKDLDLTGWELALVTNPSTEISTFQERQLKRNNYSKGREEDG